MLFQETGNKERRDSGRVQNAGFVLPPWHVGHLLTKLAGALSAGGLQAFLTLDLKVRCGSACQKLFTDFTAVVTCTILDCHD